MEHQKDWITSVQPLAYAYSIQVHCSTNQTPYSLKLSRHPQRLTHIHIDNVVPTDTYGETFPQLLRSKLKAQVYALHAKVDAHCEKLQQRHKHDYDPRVHEKQVFKPHELVFVARLALTVTKGSNALSLTTVTYNKLLCRTLGPLRVIDVQSHTVTKDENGLPNTLFIERVSHAPTSTTLSHPRQTHTRLQANSALIVPTSPSNRRNLPNNPIVDKCEYAVDYIVRHIGSGLSLK